MADATFDDFPQGAAVPAGQKPTTPTARTPQDVTSDEFPMGAAAPSPAEADTPRDVDFDGFPLTLRFGRDLTRRGEGRAARSWSLSRLRQLSRAPRHAHQGRSDPEC
jgi:hypothetical protein